MLFKSTFIIGESNFFFGIHSSLTSAPRSGVSDDSPWKFYLLFCPLRSTIPEKTRILFGILNVFSKTKTKCTRKKGSFLLKAIERVAKLKELLTPISARANKKTFQTKAHISPGEKVEVSELGKRIC